MLRELRSPPCPKSAEATPLERDQLFLELVILDAPRRLADAATLENLQALLEAPAVEPLASPHLLGDYDRQSAMGIVDVQGKSDRASLHRLQMTPRHAEPGVSVVDLELTLQLPNRHGASPSPTRMLSVKVPVREDTLALSRVVWDEPGQRSLVLLLRPRAVRGQADLRQIFECKMQRRHQALDPP